MEALLLAVIIFLLIILILIVQPRKIYVDKSKQTSPQETTTDTSTEEESAPENADKEKEIEVLAEKIQEKGCTDDKKREELKSEIKKIITCKCSDDPEFCRNRLAKEQDTLSAMESMFIDVELETPCLDKEYIAFENAVADMILQSGVDVCKLGKTDLKALGRYINDLVENICGQDNGLLASPHTWDPDASGI